MILRIILVGGICMRNRVEITGVNTSELVVMSHDEIMRLIKESKEGLLINTFNIVFKDLVILYLNYNNF